MQYVASLSYGKDSMAMLEAIKILGLPLDRIITADVWATETIPADLPPMVEFKAYADEEIKKRYGIEVEHFSGGTNYEACFYRVIQAKALENRKKKQLKINTTIWSFPMIHGPWCNRELKLKAIGRAHKSFGKDYIEYIGIAADEQIRIERHSKKPSVRMPLVEIGWTEADCRKWCEENGLLSPIYKDSLRGGAGSATIKEWSSSDYCGTTTRSYGPC